MHLSPALRLISPHSSLLVKSGPAYLFESAANDTMREKVKTHHIPFSNRLDIIVFAGVVNCKNIPEQSLKSDSQSCFMFDRKIG